MVLRIDRTTEGDCVVMTLSGHLSLQEIAVLRPVFEAERASTLVVDLGDVTQIDRDAVTVLSRLRTAGVKLRRCPAHIVASLDDVLNGDV